MISKVNSIGVSNGVKNNIVRNQINNQNVSSPVTQQSYSLLGYKNVDSLKALNNISFKGETELTELERSFIKNGEIRIPNLLELEEDIHMPFEQMPEYAQILNTAGLNVEIENTADNGKIIKITNNEYDPIMYGFFDTSAELPVVTYKQGKYMPVITVKDNSVLDGKSIRMFGGSHIHARNFEIKMPGEYKPFPEASARTVSFRGNADKQSNNQLLATLLHNEDKSKGAIEEYFASGAHNCVEKGDYAYEINTSDGKKVTVVLLAGGAGTRLGDLTRGRENKVSLMTPAELDGHPYRLMYPTLDAVAASGIIADGDNPNVKYLSQKHTIDEDDNVFHVEQYNSDGGAVAEGLARDIIPNDSYLVILNCDIFTNADISRVIHALVNTPDAGLIIPYYPANPERAKSFGLLGISDDESNEFGCIKVNDFLEKSKYTGPAPKPTDFVINGDYRKALAEWKRIQTARHPYEKNVYLANPGMYFLSPQAAKVLTATGIFEPGNVGLGASVIPKIVELSKQDLLKAEDGTPLKVYTMPLEAKGGDFAKWNDMGTAAAFLDQVKQVASTPEEFPGIPQYVKDGFGENTDLSTGIVYDSKIARDGFEAFKEKYNVKFAEGNIYVAGVK